MLEAVKSKLPSPPQFLLCILPERKNSDLYGCCLRANQSWFLLKFTFIVLYKNDWNPFFISLFSGNFPYWRPLEEKEFIRSWNCYTMHCSYKDQWSVPHQCALENQCKGKFELTKGFYSNCLLTPDWLINTSSMCGASLHSWVVWIPFWLWSFPLYYLRFQKSPQSLSEWMSLMAHLDEQTFHPLQRYSKIMLLILYRLLISKS